MNRHAALNYLASKGVPLQNPYWKQASDADVINWAKFIQHLHAEQEAAILQSGGTLVSSAESLYN